MKITATLLFLLLLTVSGFSQVSNDVIEFRVYKKNPKDIVMYGVLCYVKVNDSITLSLKQDSAGLILLPVKYLQNANARIHLKFSHNNYGKKEIFINSSKIKRSYKIILKRDPYIIK